MVIIVHDAILLGIIAVLAVPYLWIGYRALFSARVETEIPERHGLRDLEERP